MPPSELDSVLASLVTVTGGSATASTSLFTVGEGGGYLDVALINDNPAPASAVSWQLVGKHTASSVNIIKKGPFAAGVSASTTYSSADVFVGNPGTYYVEWGSGGVVRTNASQVNVTFRNLWRN